MKKFLTKVSAKDLFCLFTESNQSDFPVGTETLLTNQVMNKMHT